MSKSSARTSCALAFALFLCLPSRPLPAQPPQPFPNSLGVFEGQSDVGSVTPPGTAAFDAETGVYTLTAAGANLWSTVDAFHFVWKKVTGDLSLTADIKFPITTGDPSPHRKAVLMFRQTLDAGGIYADAAQHGSGMTAVQYRRANAATTQDIELNIDSPRRLRIEKRGDTLTMFLSNAGEPLHQVGSSIQLHLDGPFYVGIGLCSHNKEVVEKTTFSNVELKPLAPSTSPGKLALYSTLQTIGIEDNFRRAIVLYTARAHFEAPNWTKDNNNLIFNQDGRMFSIPANGGAPKPIDIGAATDCTGSHGLSPDGKWLAVTCTTPQTPGRHVFIVSSTGGTPRLVTEHPDSYFHSWSPDGKTIAFTRPGHGSGNIYSISVEGGTETALTTGSGISDDPDYAPDGKYIYFNTDRWGGMQIARMFPDGSHPEQITFDDFKNWTPHPSPDGKSILILSYDKSVAGHPADKDIALRILSTADSKARILVNLIGGTGTMNVPNWSPDSNHVAFVSYQMLPAEDTGSTE
jgi:Tol biopolymer transport system component